MRSYGNQAKVIWRDFAGRVIISGAEDGLLAISSPATGMTVRMLNDHKGAPITDLHVSTHKVSIHKDFLKGISKI